MLIVTSKEGETVEHAGVKVRILWAKNHKVRIRVEKVDQENSLTQGLPEEYPDGTTKSADMGKYTGD